MRNTPIQPASKNCWLGSLGQAEACAPARASAWPRGQPNVDPVIITLSVTQILKVNPHGTLETLTNKIYIAGWHPNVPR